MTAVAIGRPLTLKEQRLRSIVEYERALHPSALEHSLQ